MTKRLETFEKWLRVVTPRWQWEAAHLRYLQMHLAQVDAGVIDKLMIFMPPRHGKSEQVTIRYPVWCLERAPETRVIIGAYNQSLAERFSRRARRIALGRFALSEERNTAGDWETLMGGGIRAVGVGSGVTGHGANLIIIDDPIKSREEANSQTYRDRVSEWYTDDLYTRREPGAALVMIATRWHEDDLAGRILASEDGPNWTVVSLPAEAEADDPLGRAIGVPLWSERFGKEALRDIRTVLGAWSYAALYQQHPTPLEGALAQRDWFGVVEAVPVEAKRCRHWDFAATVKATAGDDPDWTVGTLLAEREGVYYVEDVVRERVGPGAVERLVRQTAELDGKGVRVTLEQEPGSSGKLASAALIKVLAGWPVRAIPATGDKVTRAMPFFAQAEAGNVKLKRAPWTPAWLEEVCTFPLGAHDDVVDSAAGSFAALSERPRSRKLRTW